MLGNGNRTVFFWKSGGPATYRNSLHALYCDFHVIIHVFLVWFCLPIPDNSVGTLLKKKVLF